MKFPVRQQLAPFEAPVGRDAACAGARTAVEIESRIGEPRIELHLAERQVHLVDVDRALAQPDRAGEPRRPGGARELDVGVEMAGGPVDVRHVEREEAELGGLRMQLAAQGHVRPVRQRFDRRACAGGDALCVDPAVDGADLAVAELGLEADHGGRGAQRHGARADARALHLAAREPVRDLGVGELGAQRPGERRGRAARESRERIERAEVLDPGGHARSERVERQLVAHDGGRPGHRAPLGIGTHAAGCAGEAQPLDAHLIGRHHEAHGSLERKRRAHRGAPRDRWRRR